MTLTLGVKDTLVAFRRMGVSAVGDPPYNASLFIKGEDILRTETTQVRLWTLKNMNLTYVLFLFALGFELKQLPPANWNASDIKPTSLKDNFFSTMLRKALIRKGINQY